MQTEYKFIISKQFSLPSNVVRCAFFYCHPPYKSYTEVRPLGPSNKDKETAYKLGIPGILIDYDSEGYINANFEYDDMIPLILNFGPERRANRE